MRRASLLILALSTGCRNGGSCRPEPVPTCDPKDGTCVDQPHTPAPPPLTSPTKAEPAPAPVVIVPVAEAPDAAEKK